MVNNSYTTSDVPNLGITINNSSQINRIGRDIYSATQNSYNLKCKWLSEAKDIKTDERIRLIDEAYDKYIHRVVGLGFACIMMIVVPAGIVLCQKTTKN